jgi:predicted DNA-binding transcriptional regulator AlpA
MPMSDQNFITAAEAARIVGTSRRGFLELAVSASDFPRAEPTATGGRVWPRTAVEAWAGAHTDRGPRFTGLEAPPVGEWTPQVQRIGSLAAEEARTLHHGWVGQDHLLLALLRAEAPGAAKTVLESFGIRAEALRDAFVASMGDPHEPNGLGTTWSPAAQLLLERAALEAFALADTEIASEHVVLALTSRWDGAVLTGLLAHSGIDPETVRQRVIDFTEGVPLPTTAPIPIRALEFDPAVGLEFAPTPDGQDPRRRRPWGSRVFVDADGRPIREGIAVRQYLIDRDGNPVLTTDGRAIDLLVDEQDQPVLDSEGQPRIRAVEIPPGSGSSLVRVGG